MDDLLQEFIAETRETLEALAGEIVAWEAEPGDRARLDAIFRFVHTVKGSCGFLDLPRLARLSHAAEDVLAAARDGLRAPDTRLVNAVLAIVDRIGEIVEAIDSGSALDDSGEDLLIAALAVDAAPVVAAAAAAPARAAGRSVRLNVDLLDRMMSGMSDMVLARNELARRLREGVSDPRVEAALERLSLTVGDMRDTVTRTRMQTIDALFAALPRMVRDTAAELGKAVTLTIEGGDVELDREMIEMLRDPLIHIVRNAIDHGIEAPALRRAAGKRESGRLTLSARQSGNQIIIDVADDGAGIDTARIVAKAVQAGICTDREAAAMSESERTELVFAPGLSSRDAVTTISGRGVGMDVVRANIEQIGGRTQLANAPGRGLTLTIQVPLTLSIISAIVLSVGDQRFAMPRAMIEEIVMLRGDAVRIDMVGGAPVATVRGERLPLVWLAPLLGLGDPGATLLAIVGIRGGHYALGIDAVLDAEELVVKPAAPAVMAAGLYAGQTLPDSGQPMLLLDGSGIAAAAGFDFTTVHAAAADTPAVEPERGIEALLFDDLDGVRRAMPLTMIDRVDKVARDAIAITGGRLRLSTEGRLLPMLACIDLPAGTGAPVAVLRLTDGESEIGYAIREAFEIVRLPAALAPASGALPIAGVALIDGGPVELIDALRLFAQVEGAGEAPLCLLSADDGGWMETFLKPTLEAAGYRCRTVLAPGERAAAALTMAAEAAPGAIRLRAQRAPAGPDDASIYRYDRPAVIAALSGRIAQGNGR